MEKGYSATRQNTPRLIDYKILFAVMSDANSQTLTSKPHYDEETTTRFIVKQLGYPTINRKTLLLNVAYYLPIIKSESNLQAILNAFVTSKFVFASRLTTENFNDHYLLMELISTIFLKKITISCPTIPLIRFYNDFLYVLISESDKDNFKMSSSNTLYPIYQNLIIAGIMLVRGMLNEYITPEEVLFFNKFEKKAMELFIRNVNVIINNALVYVETLNLLSVAYCFNAIDELELTQMLPLTSICEFSGYLLYESPHGLKTGLIDPTTDETSPVIKLLNRISFLTKSGFSRSANEGNFVILQKYLDRLTKFSTNLHMSTTNSVLEDLKVLNFYKNFLFSTVIIFESFSELELDNNVLNGLIINFFLIRNKQQQLHEFSVLTQKVLRVLFYLHFIVTIIGVGGFGAYHKMYTSVINILMKACSSKGEALEQLSDYFISQIQFKDLLSDQLNRSEFLFLLGFWETLVSVCSQKYYDSTIKPITFEFINKPYATIDFLHTSTTRAILENCHSVKLQSFKLESLAEYNANSSAVTDYIDTLLHQYPLVLSSHQLIFAVTSLATVLNSSGVIGQHNMRLQDIFLEKIYSKMLLEPSGKSNEAASKTEQTEQGKNEIVPPTTKTCFIYALICCVPYIENDVIVLWLQRIYEMSSKLSISEANFCEIHLWNVISKDLGLSKADIAIRWWYSKL